MLEGSSRRGRRIVVVKWHSGRRQGSVSLEVLPAASPPGELEPGPALRSGSTVARRDAIDDDVDVGDRAVAPNENGLVLIQPKNRQTFHGGPAYLSPRCGVVPIKGVVEAGLLEGSPTPDSSGRFALRRSGGLGRHLFDRGGEVCTAKLSRMDPGDRMQRSARRGKSAGNGAPEAGGGSVTVAKHQRLLPALSTLARAFRTVLSA